MRVVLACLVLLFLAVALTLVPEARQDERESAQPEAVLPAAERADVRRMEAVRVQLLARVPSAFVPNFGQWEHSARYVSRIGGAAVFLEDDGFLLSIAHEETADLHATDPLRLQRLGRPPIRGVSVRIGFANSITSRLVPHQRLTGRHTYLLEHDRRRWCTVPRYGAVRYVEPWPGIDVVCYEKNDHLEYDLNLVPGSDLAKVEFTVEGVEKLRIDDQGALILETPMGIVRQPVPSTYEVDTNGNRRKLVAHYELRGAKSFGFSVQDWTGEHPLVVDPEVLWSTFVGGAGPDRAQAITVDGAGIVTIAGYTSSLSYPTTPGAWSTSIAGNDGFVTRLDPSQPPSQQLLYSTYVGGGVVNALSVDPTGIITLAGQTTSPTFPTSSGALSVSFNGVADAFIMRLDPSRFAAQQLLYSTLLGGNDYDEAWALAVDSTGVVTVGGYTHSVDYPTTPGAWDTSFNGGADAFVARIDPSRSGPQQLTWSTFVGGAGAATAGGGAGTDHAFGLAVDAAGIVTLVGRTWCADFPTTPGAWDTTHNGFFDGFLLRLDPSQAAAQQLLYSTFLGGNRYDHAFGVSIDAASVVTVTGVTNSADLPTSQNAWDPTFNGGTDIFVSRLDPSRPTSQQLEYSTFLGGPSPEFILRHSVDATGIVTLAGTTMGTFPTTFGAFDTTFNGGAGDAFAARLDPSRPAAQQLLYSTYLGGGGGDGADSLAVDEEGIVTVTGVTTSTGFPTTPGAWSTVLMGGDAFVTRLEMLPVGVRGVGDSSPGCNGRPAIGVTTVPRVGEQSFSVTCTNAPPAALGWLFGAAATLSTPIPVLGARLWVQPGSAFLVTASARSNAVGYAELNLPIPNNPTLAGFQFYAQYAWVGPSAPSPCPALGISASRAVEITVQP